MIKYKYLTNLNELLLECENFEEGNAIHLHKLVEVVVMNKKGKEFKHKVDLEQTTNEFLNTVTHHFGFAPAFHYEICSKGESRLHTMSSLKGSFFFTT